MTPTVVLGRLLVKVLRNSNLEWKNKPSGGTSTYENGLYCGPGWGFTIEDVRSGKIKELPAAIDAIDAACKIHDQCYQDHGYFTQQCNVNLAKSLVEIIRSPSSKQQQRLDATIMAAVFAVEAIVIDPGVKTTVTTYTYIKTQISGLWGKGTLTMQQVIQEVSRQYYNAEQTLMRRARYPGN
jgi:hypothetical protein